MDNLQSKGESEASENDYYISPLNDQTSVLVVETIENVEPSIVISVDKRGSKLRKRKKSKRRKKRNTLEGLPSNSDNELKSLYNGRKSARRAVSLNDKDLKVNVSKYKLQTSRSLKVIKHLNLLELENQKITEEKSNEDLSLKEISVNISTRKDNTEDKVKTIENTIKITKDKKTFEDEKFQNMSTSEILNGYISDIENRIGFTLNQSTEQQRSSPCSQKKMLKQDIDQVCIKSKSKQKDSEESHILPMVGVVQLQQTCKMLDYISKMQHRNRVLENKIVVLEKELVEVKQLIPKSLQSLPNISQYKLRERTKSKSMLNLHIESQSGSVETKSNEHKLLISSKSDVPSTTADLKKESNVLKENKKTKHGLKNKISASIENLTKEIKSENNKKEKVTDSTKQNTSEPKSNEVVKKSNEKKMSKKAPSRLFSWGASEWRSKSVERFQPEPNKFAQIRTSSDAAEKNNKATVEWNALQELFPTQNNQPVIRSYSQAKLPSTNPFKNRKWRLKKSNVTSSNQSQSKVFLPHDAKVSLSDMEAASNLSRQSTLQLDNSEIEQIAITSFTHQDSDDRTSLSSNCTKLESLKEVFDDESSDKPKEAQQISSKVL